MVAAIFKCPPRAGGESGPSNGGVTVQGKADSPVVKRIAACLLGALACVGVAEAQVYKWVDENGVVTYSNIAPPTDREFDVLRFPCYASDPKCRSVSWEKVPLNVRSFREEIRLAAESNAVEEALIRAVIHAESAYQPDAQSPKGAQGLMQLMPQTQAELDVADPFDPAENIRGGARYLSRLLEEFRGDVELAAAAYNAGPAAVNRHKGVPPYAETQEYVRRVQILHRRYGQAL
jgi:soluble lytic murein transglycosylase-like protein